MKFRYHRGGLNESLATEVEFNSLKELQQLIIIEDMVKSKKMQIEYYGYDTRVDQDLYMVKGTFLVDGTEMLWPMGYIYD